MSIPKLRPSARKSNPVGQGNEDSQRRKKQLKQKILKDIILTATGILTGRTLGGPAAHAVATALTDSPSTQNFYVDVQKVKFTAYAIGGNNYVKLRDVRRAVDFGVTCDSAFDSSTSTQTRTMKWSCPRRAAVRTSGSLTDRWLATRRCSGPGNTGRSGKSSAPAPTDYTPCGSGMCTKRLVPVHRIPNRSQLNRSIHDKGAPPVYDGSPFCYSPAQKLLCCK